MTDLDTGSTVDVAVRLVAVAELLLLSGSARYLHLRYRAGMPRPLLVVARCITAVLAFVVLAVVLNIATAGPATPGMYLLAGGAVIPAVVLTVVALRDLAAARRG